MSITQERILEYASRQVFLRSERGMIEGRDRIRVEVLTRNPDINGVYWFRYCDVVVPGSSAHGLSHSERITSYEYVPESDWKKRLNAGKQIVKNDLCPSWDMVAPVVCTVPGRPGYALDLVTVQHLIRMQEAFRARFERSEGEMSLSDSLAKPTWLATNDRINGLIQEFTRNFLQAVVQITSTV